MNIETILRHLATREPRIMGSENFKQSAVLIPLVEIEGEAHILFEVRSMQLRVSPEIFLSWREDGFRRCNPEGLCNSGNF